MANKDLSEEGTCLFRLAILPAKHLKLLDDLLPRSVAADTEGISPHRRPYPLSATADVDAADLLSLSE